MTSGALDRNRVFFYNLSGRSDHFQERGSAMRRLSEYDLSRKVGGRYALVIAVAKRATQLNEGARPLVESHSDNAVAVALQEIAEGKVVVVPSEAAEESG
jgi:DNA-directed RNA polymerase subunit omega